MKGADKGGAKGKKSFLTGGLIDKNGPAPVKHIHPQVCSPFGLIRLHLSTLNGSPNITTSLRIILDKFIKFTVLDTKQPLKYLKNCRRETQRG